MGRDSFGQRRAGGRVARIEGVRPHGPREVPRRRGDGRRTCRRRARREDGASPRGGEDGAREGRQIDERGQGGARSEGRGARHRRHGDRSGGDGEAEVGRRQSPRRARPPRTRGEDGEGDAGRARRRVFVRPAVSLHAGRAENLSPRVPRVDGGRVRFSISTACADARRPSVDATADRRAAFRERTTSREASRRARGAGEMARALRASPRCRPLRR